MRQHPHLVRHDRHLVQTGLTVEQHQITVLQGLLQRPTHADLGLGDTGVDASAARQHGVTNLSLHQRLLQQRKVVVGDLDGLGQRAGNALRNTYLGKFQTVVAGDDTPATLVHTLAHAVTPHSALLALDPARQRRVLPAVAVSAVGAHLVVVHVAGDGVLQRFVPFVGDVGGQRVG